MREIYLNEYRIETGRQRAVRKNKSTSFFSLFFLILFGISLNGLHLIENVQAQGIEPFTLQLATSQLELAPCANLSNSSIKYILKNNQPDFKDIEVTTTISGVQVSPMVFIAQLGPFEEEVHIVKFSLGSWTSVRMTTALVSTRLVGHNGLPALYDIPRNTAFEVAVLLCGNISVKASDTEFVTRQGNAVQLGLAVTNLANGMDSLSIDMKGVPHAWMVSNDLSGQLKDLEPFETRKVTLILDPQAHGKFILKFTISSSAEGERGHQLAFDILVEVARPWSHFLGPPAFLIFIVILVYQKKTNKKLIKI